MAYKNEPTGTQSVDLYLTRFGFEGEDGNISPLISDVVDRNSWEKLFSSYYRDKNKVYCTRAWSSGEWLFWLDGANPKTFKPWYDNSWRKLDYVRDKFSKVEETYKVKLNLKSQWLSRYTTDGDNVYFDCLKIDKADSKTFYVDAIHSWWAIDKNFIYAENKIISVEEFNKEIIKASEDSRQSSEILVEELRKLLRLHNELQQ